MSVLTKIEVLGCVCEREREMVKIQLVWDFIDLNQINLNVFGIAYLVASLSLYEQFHLFPVKRELMLFFSFLLNLISLQKYISLSDKLVHTRSMKIKSFLSFCIFDAGADGGEIIYDT